MNNKVTAISKYIINNHKFAKYRMDLDLLMRVIYLCDWKYAIEEQEKLTGLKWYNSVNRIHTENFIYSVFSGSSEIELSDKELKVIDFVLEKTDRMDVGEFITLCYSTYPMITSDVGKLLHLVPLAKKYKEFLKTQETSQ